MKNRQVIPAWTSSWYESTIPSAGRDYLQTKGYQQVSMRMFKRDMFKSDSQPEHGFPYRCQEDGMVGMGAGARSYSKSLHYATEYAVGRDSIKSLIEFYAALDSDHFKYAHYGIQLSYEEQLRRYLIQSLLLAKGLNTSEYKEKFGTDCMSDFALLNELLECGLATWVNDTLRLTPEGLEASDTIGPWLISNDIEKRMNGYTLR